MNVFCIYHTKNPSILSIIKFKFSDKLNLAHTSVNMQFPIQPAGGYFPNQPVSRPYPGGAYPQPQIYPQQIGYGMPPSYPAQNSPPFISAPSVMGGQFRGPQMHPYQPQPLLIGNRPMAMGFPQPYRPIHP